MTNKRYFKDCYGCTAVIEEKAEGARLKVSNAHGGRIANKLYKSYRGARIAMGRMSDGWREVH